MLFGDFFKDAIFVDVEQHPAMEELAKEFHGPVAMALHGLTSPPFWLALAGVVAGLVHVHGQPGAAGGDQARVPADLHAAGKQVLHGLVQRERDRRAARALLGTGLWKGGDEAVIDGAHGQRQRAQLVGWIAGVVRWFQTGYIYHYAFAMIVGVFVLMTYFVSWPMPDRTGSAR